MPRPELKFYCFTTKRSFTTPKYGLIKRINKRTKLPVYIAMTKHKGTKCARIMKKEHWVKLKKYKKK